MFRRILLLPSSGKSKKDKLVLACIMQHIFVANYSCLPTAKMEAKICSEMSVINYQSTRRHAPENNEIRGSVRYMKFLLPCF